MANILYRKQKQQISLDNGATWIDMDVYRVGEILENHSNCTSEQTKQCRWVELDITENYYCDNYNKYSLEVEECTENGLIWTPTGEYRKGSTLIETKSSDCGYNYVTTQVSDVLSFKYASDESLEYKINGETTHTATTSPYSITLEDLGVTRLYNTTSMFEGTRLTELISIPNISNLVYASGMFSHCQDLLFLDLSECPVKATHMDYMFYGCDNLKYLDISSFDTTNTREMNSMFEGCEDLTTLDVSHFVTTSAITMSYMFAFCYKLNSLNVSNFNTSKVTDMSGMFLDCRSLTSLDVSNFNTSKVTDMNNMFNVCSGLTSLDLSNFDTSNVTNVSYMFTACKSLTSLNVTGWDISNINSYTDMFTACSSLSELILGEVSQSTYDWWCARLTEASISCDIIECTIISEEVTEGDLSFDFSGSSTTYKLNNTTYTATSSPYTVSLADLGINELTNCNSTFSSSSITKLTSFFDTSNVTNMSNMFFNCTNLTELDLSNFNTSNVTTMSNMFIGCNNLAALNISDWDTSNVTDIQGMFGLCSGLTTLDLSSWNTSKVLNMSSMFNNCPNLHTINVTGWDISNVKSMKYMFSGDNKLTKLILGEVTQQTYNWWCERLTESGLSCDVINCTIIDSPLSFEFEIDSYVYRLNGTRYTATSSPHTVSLADLGIDTLTSCSQTFNYLDDSNWPWINYSITKLNSFPDTSNVNSMQSMFAYCSGLTSLDVSNFNTSNVTNMSFMFQNCSGLTTLDVSNFDTSNVTTMYLMFGGCSGLISLDLSNFDTSNVTEMGSMFSSCSGLTTLDLSNFDTSNVTRLERTFSSCSGLTELDLSNFNTSNVTEMDWMFNGCSSLTELDLSNFDTSNVTYMSSMFNDCYNLRELDVSSWDISKVTSYSNMFVYCTSLQTLKIKEGTYDWWCARLSDAGISCDIIECTIISDTLSFEFTGDTTTYILNGTTYTATSSPYTVSLDDLGIETLTSFTFEESSITKLISFPDTSNITDMSYRFYYCTSLIELDLSSFNTSNVVAMHNMFNNCYYLKTLNVSGWDISKVGYKHNMFTNCNSLNRLILGEVTQSTYDWWCERLSEASISCNIIECTIISEPDTPTGETTSDTLSFEFSGSTTTYILNNKTYTATSSPYSTTLDDLGIETLTSCDTTFGFNSSITKVTSFPDTSNVTRMDSMFWNCKNITSINLSNWNTSNVTSMIAMFSDCSGLTSLDLSSFDTSNVTNMNYMFRRCSNLQTLNVTRWNVLQVTSYTDMFINCTSLNRLILGEVNQSTYNWWCARLTDAGLSYDIIEYTIVSRPGGGIVDAE